jgi:hypothetical protein
MANKSAALFRAMNTRLFDVTATRSMLAIGSSPNSLVPLLLLQLASSGFLLAQQPKVLEKDGHISPLVARVTFLNGRTRDVAVSGIGSKISGTFFTHVFFVRTEGGASKRRFWLDTVRAINGTGSMRSLKSEFTVVLKNGSEIPAMFVGGWGMTGCDAGNEPDSPESACAIVHLANQDEGDEQIDLRQIKSLEFLTPLRKDKAGNAMFENWRFSPFTGERLPIP